ncbi:zinc ribbon domain-containing protein [uncultured Methanobrevibacter sp.]|uniref:zinc ribbon domain-containing protein n=1 Tax=uncultured Methanobrevibacter sp. TaxID=253161 RepID=UPI002625AC3A|nr:zinc ribbon domain-containing protein [uncultured Methanobrevibacter sp.]
MVKCSRCGVTVDDSFNTCPNCGNSFEESQEAPVESKDEKVCGNCGAALKDDVTFCSSCGSKVETDNGNRCKGCGSEVPENVLFCPTCGAKVEQKQPPKVVKTCPNCGFPIDDENPFCQECGTNLETGSKPIIENKGFVDKIDLNSIIKPTIISLVVALVLSSIGLLIGFSWLSFIFAIILSAGFFAGLVDNEANATIMGLIVGLLLGLLENPLVEFWYGGFVAGVYDWIFGGQIILLIILGIVCAYISNIYLKDNIQNIAGKYLTWI